MSTASLINWFHLLAVILWVGGLSFQQLALLPATADSGAKAHPVFAEAAKKFVPLTWTAIALILGSGVFRIGNAGGMKELNPLVHVKILIAAIMIILGIISITRLVPRLGDDEKAFKTYKCLSWLIITGGIAILLLLAMAGAV